MKTMSAVLAGTLLLVSHGGDEFRGQGRGSGSEAAEEASHADVQTLFYSARSRSVKSIAKTLAMLLVGDSQVIVVPDEESNTIIIRGSEQTLKQTTQLLNAIDPSVRTIQLEVSISVVDTEAGASQQAEYRILDQLNLSSLENVPVRVQFGQEIPIQSGVQQIGGRPVSRSYQRLAIGTLVEATARIVGNEVVASIELEKSWIEDRESEETEVSQIPLQYTTNVSSTLHLRPETSQTIQAEVSGGSGAGKQVEITVSAQIGAKSTSQSTARARDGFSGSRRNAASEQPGGTRSGRPGPPSGFRGSSRTSPFNRSGFGGSRERLGRPGSSTGGSADRFFQALDRNKDGRIDSEEISRVPQLRERLGDGDQPLTMDQFMKLMQQRTQAPADRSPTRQPQKQDQGTERPAVDERDTEQPQDDVE